MKLWLLLIAAFVAQEVVFMNATLLQAYRAGYGTLLMALIFFAASLFDVLVGYTLGKWTQRRFEDAPATKKIARKAHAAERMLGEKGSRLGLTVLGFTSFNYVNAFLTSWTSIPLGTAARYLVLGDLLWYASALALVTGVEKTVNPFAAIYVLIGISLVFLLANILFQRRFLNER